MCVLQPPCVAAELESQHQPLTHVVVYFIMSLYLEHHSGEGNKLARNEAAKLRGMTHLADADLAAVI